MVWIVCHAIIATEMVHARVTGHAKEMANVHVMPAIPVNIASIVQSIITNHSVMIANYCVANVMWHVKRIPGAQEPAQKAAVHAKKDGLWKPKVDVLMLMNARAAHTNAQQINFA